MGKRLLFIVMRPQLRSTGINHSKGGKLEGREKETPQLAGAFLFVKREAIIIFAPMSGKVFPRTTPGYFDNWP